jgi:hypothetical protein
MVDNLLRPLDQENSHTTLHLMCVPRVCNNHNDNLGFAKTDIDFENNALTRQVISIMENKEMQYTLITFGSMKPVDLQSRLNSLVYELKTPVIIVCSVCEPNETYVRFNEVTHDVNKTFLSTDLIIVNSINYQSISRFICRAHIHGGCGTMITLMAGNIPLTIHPIAYDQEDNATWYKNIELRVTDLVEHINDFRKNMAYRFQLPEQEEFIEPMSSTMTSKQTGTHEYIINNYKVDVEIIDEIATSNNCVRIAINKLLKVNAKDQRDRWNNSYEDFICTRTIMDISDVIYIVIQAKISINLVDENTKTLYILSHNLTKPSSELAASINDTATHMRIVKFEPTKVKDSINLQKVNTSDIKLNHNDSDCKITTKQLMLLLSCSENVNATSKKEFSGRFNASNNVDISNRSKNFATRWSTLRVN